MEVVKELGGTLSFIFRFLKSWWLPPFETREFLRQCYEIGYRSLGLISLTGFIMGLVLTLQSEPTLKQFGAESFLPSMVSISIVREIGPIITALICAGKIASSIGAELGSMKVTEQIDAMEVSATNPFKFLVITRIMACTLMIPILVFYADLLGILGGYVGVNLGMQMNMQLYILKVTDALTFHDIIPATIKSFTFGMAIGSIGCFKGWYTTDGTAGVGKAAHEAVVSSCIAVFVLDLIAVQLTSLFNVL
jgi:phospholipid/cholesterol/gamma-HCH transport system permease protein